MILNTIFDYNKQEMFDFVKIYLEKNPEKKALSGHFPFRVRSEHIQRVCIWAVRLFENIESNVDTDSLLISAIFHDVGYGGLKEDKSHAINSVEIFREFACRKSIPKEKIDFICYLIENHSNKELLKVPETPIELILLMEADLLDETGALSIVWDCMAEGKKEQNFESTYQRILSYSGDILNQNPMVTENGKRFWIEKQKLTKLFIDNLKLDLGL